MTANAPKLNVFISYSRADLDFAQQLVEGMELLGFNPVIDRDDISGGEDWKDKLGRQDYVSSWPAKRLFPLLLVREYIDLVFLNFPRYGPYIGPDSSTRPGPSGRCR